MKDKKYAVIEINDHEFMPVTKALNKLNLQYRPVGFYYLLDKRMRAEADKVADISKFTNPYLIQIIK